MRILLLFRGAPGCGKTTFIKEHGLEDYALSADTLRLMCSSPVRTKDGELSVNQKVNNEAWKTLYNLLEVRMSRGEFTVIDATNSKTSEMNNYKKLAKMYRYRMFIVDMTTVPIDVCKKQNKQRSQLKVVPDEAIDLMYSRFETQSVPAGFTVIKPEELDTIWQKPIDLSTYKEVNVIGDIHGCATALSEIVTPEIATINKDTFYIFTGDYLDRGIENVKTFKLISELIELPNTYFMLGNHEESLRLWANGSTVRSSDFSNTYHEFMDAGVSKKSVRMFLQRLGQCSLFTYCNNTYLVTHGGLSNYPQNLSLVSTHELIHGSDDYKYSTDIGESFSAHCANNVFQVHGHRNVSSVPIDYAPNSFNLEGGVEYGGDLRVLTITKTKQSVEHTFKYIPNTVYSIPDNIADEELCNLPSPDTIAVEDLVDTMRKSRGINEKKYGNISSFNFSNNVFRKSSWNKFNVKARGLFINTALNKICARSYDKFFNVDEQVSTRLATLKCNLQFPVSAYVKENGFLGIIGYNPEKDDFLICSKSSIVGEHSKYLRHIFYKHTTTEGRKDMLNYLKDNDSSFVFECIDPVNDPHIIEYDDTRLVLLDVVKNSVTFSKLPYEELVNVANTIGLMVKEKAATFESWSELFAWYTEVNDEEYTYHGECIEGFVLEDSVGFMTKLKLHYYKLWKHLRSVAESSIKYGYHKYTGSLLTPLHNRFYAYCREIYKANIDPENGIHVVKNYPVNIIKLRREFYELHKEEVN